MLFVENDIMWNRYRQTKNVSLGCLWFCWRGRLRSSLRPMVRQPTKRSTASPLVSSILIYFVSLRLLYQTHSCHNTCERGSRHPRVPGYASQYSPSLSYQYLLQNLKRFMAVSRNIMKRALLTNLDKSFLSHSEEGITARHRIAPLVLSYKYLLHSLDLFIAAQLSCPCDILYIKIKQECTIPLLKHS